MYHLGILVYCELVLGFMLLPAITYCACAVNVYIQIFGRVKFCCIVTIEPRTTKLVHMKNECALIRIHSPSWGGHADGVLAHLLGESGDISPLPITHTHTSPGNVL